MNPCLCIAFVVAKSVVDNLWITLLLTGGFLRLPDTLVVGLAERSAENFCLKLSMIFDPRS
jgi:hypothetical protein